MVDDGKIGMVVEQSMSICFIAEVEVDNRLIDWIHTFRDNEMPVTVNWCSIWKQVKINRVIKRKFNRTGPDWAVGCLNNPWGISINGRRITLVGLIYEPRAD